MSSTEPWIRLATFGAVFATLALWEIVAPARARTCPRGNRWPANIGVTVLGTIAVRLLFPTAAVGMALIAQERGWGLLNAVHLPRAASIVIAVIALDLAIYTQHVLFHAVPAFWRVHRMHHADLDVDVTTGVRFHPLEIVVSMLIKIGVVAALGAPALAVVVFEVALNALAMFNHANIRLSRPVDAALRLILVTPDMHRVHHSIVAAETNSNFGFQLSWWDRLFGTYRGAPAAGRDGMIIGLPIFRDPRELRLDRMLIQPFVSTDGS